MELSKRHARSAQWQHWRANCTVGHNLLSPPCPSTLVGYRVVTKTLPTVSFHGDDLPEIFARLQPLMVHKVPDELDR